MSEYYSITGVPILNPENNEKVFGKGLTPQETISRAQTNVLRNERDTFKLKVEEFYLPTFLTGINDRFIAPELEADNIYSHVDKIAQTMAEPWYSMLNELEANPRLPPIPAAVLAAGWVKYPYCWEMGSYGSPQQIPYPDSDIFVFDCETMVQLGNHPIMAGAVSRDAFYIWLHPCIVNSKVEFGPNLIPVGEGKLIIGHNVAFDRSRTLEAHKFGKPQNCFVDTMSLHNVSSGLTSQQKTTAAYLRKQYANGNPLYFHFKGSAASLVEVYAYHMKQMGHTDQDKTTRNLFVKAESVAEIRANLGRLIKYMCLDCFYTYQMFPEIWRKYKIHAPSKVNFVGMNIISSSSQFTVVPDWYEWLQKTEDIFTDKQVDLKVTIINLANELYERWKKAKPSVKREIQLDDSYKNLDWTIPVASSIDIELLKRYFPMDVTEIKETIRPSKYQFVPMWYQKIFKDMYDAKVSNKSVITHFLMRVHWNGMPILYDKTNKFGYLDAEGNWNKLPHKNGKDRDGEDLNVGGCLNRDFSELAEEGILTFEVPGGSEIFKKSLELSYWMSTRDRVWQQRVFSTKMDSGEKVNILLPLVVPHNTVTGRTGESLWLTVPDTDKNRVGTELKTRIQAAPGQKFVYFDFDSQEYAIFGMFGDHNTQEGKLRSSCSSPTGFISFGGSKENQSDPHWTLAKIAGISRQIAKNVNYAVIYGGGMSTVTNTVHTGDRLMLRKQAAEVAMRILEAKKGKKVVDPRNPECLVTRFGGGCDSAAFNFMEELVMRPKPSTPMLNKSMPESLWWNNLPTPSTYKTNRINWTIQSSGADMLAVMCTLVTYLFAKYGINGHFMFSYHDQLLFTVDEERCYEAAYLINIAHMWTWVLMRYQLDIYDIVVTNLFPSATTIDTIFRKEGTKSTRTPSQLVDEPYGEDLNILQIMDKLSPEFLARI